MKKLSVMALVLSLLGGAAANAATVHFILDLSGAPGTYQLRAGLEGADGFGLAAYSVELGGTGNSILTGNHNATRGAVITAGGDGSDEGPAGFTLLRTADFNTARSLAAFSGSQDIPGATPHLIYGMGQTAGSFAALNKEVVSTPGSTEGASWAGYVHDADFSDGILLAQGTYGAGGIDFLAGSSLTLASVFTEATGATTLPAQIATHIVPIPEPATIVLAGMGVIGCIAASRRRVS